MPIEGSASRRFLQVLAEATSKGCNIKQLLSRSKLKGKITEEQFNQAIAELLAKKQIEQFAPGKFRLLVKSKVIEGNVEVAKDGYYYVLDKDLNIEVVLSGSPKIFAGDTVVVRIEKSPKRTIQGTVIEVLKRRREVFIGTILQDSQGELYCVAHDPKMKIEFSIQPSHLKGARHGDKVQVRFLRWKRQLPEAEVLKVLGQMGTHEVEINAIVLEFGLEVGFPPEVQAEADAIPRTIPLEEIQKRRDFRQVLTLTIDPEDAKDFDDAISFQIITEGQYQGYYEIGVHIADVTYYLKEGSLLDSEAADRATSVYLVDRTLPMLPEVLSNDLCSLRPHEDRLCYAAVFIMTPEGVVVDEWFGRTVIHSSRRFTYEEVQLILESGEGEYAAELLILNRIAHVLRKDRFAAGSINFESDEVKFRLDKDGKPIAVYKKVRKDAHKLIEDYMLLANRRVARFVTMVRKDPPIPFVYRIHGVPDSAKLVNLKAFVQHFGYDINVKNEEAVAKSLNELVLSVEGKPEQNIIQSIAIRAMPKAIYTTRNIGHYGLGFDYYTHFTSPIRRYPDVLCHRVLTQVLEKNIKIEEEALEKLCKHSSDRERRAAEAERASVKYKQVEYLGMLIGKIFDGTVSGVTEWGMYVELDDNKCEGMIPLRDLTDDVYQLNDTRYKLVGRNTGRTFALGDRLRIQIKKTNLLKRIIDFSLVEKLPPINAK